MLPQAPEGPIISDQASSREPCEWTSLALAFACCPQVLQMLIANCKLQNEPPPAIAETPQPAQPESRRIGAASSQSSLLLALRQPINVRQNFGDAFVQLDRDR